MLPRHDDDLIDLALVRGRAAAQGHHARAAGERSARALEPECRRHGKPWLPFANGFATANGKARIYNEDLIAEGMDPVASFIAPEESRHQDAAKKYPLELLARKADNFLNSTFVNLPGHQKMEPHRDELEIAYDDAKPRGIADGDRVRVFNDRGEIFLRARVDGAVQAGVVGARLGWAKLSEGGVNINVLTSARLADLRAGRRFTPRWSRWSGLRREKRIRNSRGCHPERSEDEQRPYVVEGSAVPPALDPLPGEPADPSTPARKTRACAQDDNSREAHAARLKAYSVAPTSTQRQQAVAVRNFSHHQGFPLSVQSQLERSCEVSNRSTRTV